MPSLSWSSFRNPTVFLSLGLMVIIIMMVLPVPTWVLDAGLTASFAFAILIFTITLFIERPLDFSSFPAVLLASLLLRLSLNISSTKLIIGNGHTGPGAAGGVIEGFAMFIMDGNVFIGLIVFCVLVIVNFMVITKGAGRMAEVGARFALDAMPGKQMAIDADLAAGAINHQEAHQRRTQEQEETAFLGSLDGVSKFMKGDAIAGLLITGLNLIAGMAIGMGVHRISFSEAIQNYSVLTVGDGMVSQIPAVIISIAAGLLLAKGKSEGTVDFSLFQQVLKYPAAIFAVATIMFAFALLPGLPFLPFTIGAAVLGYLALRTVKAQAQEKRSNDEEKEDVNAAPAKPLLGDTLDLDEIHVELAKELVPIMMGSELGFEQRVEKIRKYIASEFGFILPSIRLTDNVMMDKNTYCINIQGSEVATNLLRPSYVLALMEEGEHPHIKGFPTKEPVYQASARWIQKTDQDELMMLGVPTVEVSEVLATHLLEIIQANFSKLLNRRSLRDTLDAFKMVSDPDRAVSNKKILEEFLPDKVPLETLQSVMRLLLEERVSVRNLPLILEAVAEGRANITNVEQLAEYVRQRLSYHFVSKLKDEKGRLPLVQLGPDWEGVFCEHEQVDENGRADIALPPETFSELSNSVKSQLDKSAEKGCYAAVATHAKRRRFIRSVLSAKGIRNPVFSYDEIASYGRPAIVGVA